MNQRFQNMTHTLREMRGFLLLWLTQSFSGLGSSITSYALVIWSYTQEGSALTTGLLMVSTYAPYVMCSIFAGALTDRWDKRKTMLVCDAAAALCTIVTLLLLETGQLQVWHLYIINAVNGLMNTVQQPASEVATTAILPRKYYQKVGSLRQLSGSMSGILTPVLATAMLAMTGLRVVIAFDLITFAVAFLTLLLMIRIPNVGRQEKKEPFLQAIREGIRFLMARRGILMLILFLAGINLVASMFNAALPALILPRPNGGETALGVVKTVTAVTTLLGSMIAAALPAPKSRVRVVCLTLMLSMSTENFLLAFGKSLPVWCLGAFLGWIAIPLMNTNLDAILRLNIPAGIQGRVFAARNSLQFFTIPLGYLLGGAAVDYVFEPLMARQLPESLAVQIFGLGKGSGAACFFAVLAPLGMLVCIFFMRNRHLRAMIHDELKNNAK